MVLAAASLSFSPALDGLCATCVDRAQALLAAVPTPGGPSFGAIVFITVVLFASGVVSGLAGFAFSAIAACVLWLLPPLQAVPLIMLAVDLQPAAVDRQVAARDRAAEQRRA